MSELFIQGRDLIKKGWETGPAIGLAVAAAQSQLKAGFTPNAVSDRLDAIHQSPAQYVDDVLWGETAKALVQDRLVAETFELRAEPAPLTVWGRKLIDEKSFEQINNAARLPVTMRVALMPDAHIGYGLPIGGVAALEGAIAPYMVGVDIGCRMHATIFERSPIHLKQQTAVYKQILIDSTYFGRNAPRAEQRRDHPILEDSRFEQLPRHLQAIKEVAVKQLGTSGGGNHFAEWVDLDVKHDNPLGLNAGHYIAFVTHSGSRGVGYKIADYYCNLAEQLCSFLPKNLRKLGYLDYRAGDGAEYEMAMSLAGDFAKANHEIIHQRVTEALGGTVLGTIQNHHNFAWRVDRKEGAPVFIHRKGATPAARGVLGIIPGSMAAPGFFVEGRGDSAENILQNASLNSAAHGSGRQLGRRQAFDKLNARDVQAFLAKRGVTLLGGGLDEAPNAYKNSRDVIAAQTELVKVWAEFNPVIVRMAGDGQRSLGEPMRDKAQGQSRRRKKKRRR